MVIKKKKQYETPCAYDLSGFSVNGQDQTLAICQAGNSPISYTCATGADPTQPEACSPTGLLPSYGRCTNGGNAVEGCYPGSSVDDCVSGSSFVT